jgi:kynurenine formamidase
VRDGIVVSLAHAEPQTVAADVGAPGIFHRVTNAITEGGTTDNYQVSYHGQTVAHIDTWCHFFENGQMYNGVSVKENLTPETGCLKGSVMNWRGGVTTRAVLYDMTQLKGVDWNDPTVPIRRADLEAWEVRSGVKIGPGDIPLLYTGRWKRRAAVGPWSIPVAGYYPDTIPWMHDRLPSFIGHDFNIDWNPRPGWEGMRNPIHIAALNWMGINIVECLDLEELVATARLEPLRVPDHVRAAAGRRRHRLAGQPAGDVLACIPRPDIDAAIAGAHAHHSGGVPCRRCDLLHGSCDCFPLPTAG